MPSENEAVQPSAPTPAAEKPAPLPGSRENPFPAPDVSVGDVENFNPRTHRLLETPVVDDRDGTFYRQVVRSLVPRPPEEIQAEADREMAEAVEKKIRGLKYVVAAGNATEDEIRELELLTA